MNSFIKHKEEKPPFTPEEFYKKIILENNCFVCGINQKESVFNNEHIFPKWMIRDFKMYNDFIDLPNGGRHRYSTYTVPCCAKCNNQMGNEIEKPLSAVLLAGHDSVYNYLSRNDPWILYTWLARIFLKTHLKDKNLRQFIDPRKGETSIGDNYRWEGFYLPFLFSRAFYTRTTFDAKIMGTFLVFPVEDNKNDLSGRWMYVDDTNTLTMLLQIRDVGFIASFGDFGIAFSAMDKIFKKIGKRSINPSQLAELAAHVAMINSIYGNRPKIHYNRRENKFSTILPAETIINKVDEKEWGYTMFHFTHKLVQDVDLLESIKMGKRTFLWDVNGNFITTHLS